MASGIYGSCLSCLHEFSTSRYPVILTGCACADRMCQICSKKWLSHDQITPAKSLSEIHIKMCQTCQNPVLGIQPDRFFIAHMKKLNEQRSLPSSSTIDIAPVDISHELNRSHYQQVLSDKKFKQLFNDHKSSELKTFMSAIAELEAAAITEDIRVLFLLYTIYMSGEKVPRHREKATNYLLRAATNGCLNSKTILGTYYILGVNFKQDISLGLKCLKDAAEEGYLRAVQILSTFYKPSANVTCYLHTENETHKLKPSDHKLIQNNELYLYYLQKSAELGCANGYLQLAQYAYNNIKIPTADERCYVALDYLEKAKVLGIKLKDDIALCKKIEINIATTLNGSEKPVTPQSSNVEPPKSEGGLCTYQ